MMDIFEDEVCSQDDFFVAPPLTIKHSPLPYLSEPCFQKPCGDPSPCRESLRRDETRPYVAVAGELASPTPVSVFSNTATSKLQEQAQYPHKHGFALTLPVATSLKRNEMELSQTRHDPLMTCRYALKLQGWSPDTIFPLEKSPSLEKRATQRTGCLKRPAVELFHPRQLKAVRHL